MACKKHILVFTDSGVEFIKQIESWAQDYIKEDILAFKEKLKMAENYGNVKAARKHKARIKELEKMIKKTE